MASSRRSLKLAGTRADQGVEIGVGDDRDGLVLRRRGSDASIGMNVELVLVDQPAAEAKQAAVSGFHGKGSLTS